MNTTSTSGGKLTFMLVVFMAVCAGLDLVFSPLTRPDLSNRPLAGLMVYMVHSPFDRDGLEDLLAKDLEQAGAIVGVPADKVLPSRRRGAQTVTIIITKMDRNENLVAEIGVNWWPEKIRNAPITVRAETAQQAAKKLAAMIVANYLAYRRPALRV